MKRAKYIAIILAFIVLPVLSQDRLPREYVSPQELCSINGQLEFKDALNILSEYSISFANKPIFDPTKQTGPIGVDIEAMQWEKALQMMLSTRGLWYTDKEHFYEIVLQTQASSGKSGSGDVSGINVGIGSREIKIETIFFEGNRTAISEMGIDWSTFYNGKVSVSGDQLGASSLGESFMDIGVTMPSKTFDVDVRALFSVFDSKNIGKVLAQPQVIVTEGNQGQIQVGEDFSIKTRDFAGNVIDRFFSTGTIMEVTPFVIKDTKRGQAIVMKVHVERSQAQPDEVSTIIYKSQANSYIQLFDGEETIIAGLYNTEKSQLRKGLPIIKDLPPWFFGLSYIFGYNREQVAQKELIIIIKASILPSVFERKQNPVDQNFWQDDAELKLRQYQRQQDIEPNFPSREVRAVYNEPFEESQAIESNRYVPQPRSAAPKLENKSQYSDNRNTRNYQNTTLAPAPKRQPTLSVKEQSAANNNLVQQKSVYKPVTRTAQNQKNYYLGQVEKVDDDIVLIKWQNDFDTDILHGNRFSVIRVNGNNKPETVGQVVIQSTKYERSIGHKIIGQVYPGDMIVVKFDNNA